MLARLVLLGLALTTLAGCVVAPVAPRPYYGYYGPGYSRPYYGGGYYRPYGWRHW